MMTEGEKNALQKALADEDYFESAMRQNRFMNYELEAKGWGEDKPFWTAERGVIIK